MELMSSLLLCVLVALLPQTLGKSDFNDSLEKKYNNSYRKNKKATHSRMLLNMYGTDLGRENSDLHAVFSDIHCQKCYTCMERAIKAHNTYFTLMKNRPSAEDLQEDILMNQIVEKRYKRDAPKTNAVKKDSSKPKSPKPKKNKPPKSVSVTKYDLDGEVYALKVKETKDYEGKNAGNGSCQVFSVNKAIPCESPQSNTLLAEARRKSKKSDKKDTPKPTTTTTTPKVRVAVFKKREADNSDMPPEFMSSTEEMF